tara:strand:- start:3771 stop:3992 length:222 start_codon:yes stop_codon:yes gene_type:complete
MSDSVTKWHELNEEGWWTKNPKASIRIDDKIALEIAEEKLSEIKWVLEEYYNDVIKSEVDLIHHINKIINKIK